MIDQSDAGAERVWAELSNPWQTVFTEAWTSWQARNWGIGAALVDPNSGVIVSVGRNRAAQTDPELRTLSGNMTAHAEMNAFAALDRFNATGLHLYTTLQPCLMCIGTAMQLKVAHIHLAQRDEYFDGMDELWAKYPVTAERFPPSTGPLPGRLAQIARLMPLVFNFEIFPDGRGTALAAERHPELAAIATDIVTGECDDPRLLPDFVTGLTHLWGRLPTGDNAS